MKFRIIIERGRVGKENVVQAHTGLQQDYVSISKICFVHQWSDFSKFLVMSSIKTLDRNSCLDMYTCLRPTSASVFCFLALSSDVTL